MTEDMELFLRLMMSWDTPEWEKNRAEFIRLMELDEVKKEQPLGLHHPVEAEAAV